MKKKNKKINKLGKNILTLLVVNPNIKVDHLFFHTAINTVTREATGCL